MIEGIAPFQGLDGTTGLPRPRAMPWAGTARPFMAAAGARKPTWWPILAGGEGGGTLMGGVHPSRPSDDRAGTRHRRSSTSIIENPPITAR